MSGIFFYLYVITADLMWGRTSLDSKVDWNYRDWHVTLSMTKYINQALNKFQHPLNLKPKNSQSNYKDPTYGTKIQCSNPEETRKLLPSSEITHVQKFITTVMNYTNVLDNTMLVAIGDLVSTQKNHIEDNEINNTPLQIRINSPKCKFTIPQEQKDTPYLHQFLLLILNQSIYCNWSTLLPRGQHPLLCNLKMQ